MVAQPVIVGRAVKEIRELKCYTQEQLAEKAELGRLTISQIETGRRGLSKQTACEVAKALEVPVSFLYLLADQSDDPLVKKFKDTARAAIRSSVKSNFAHAK